MDRRYLAFDIETIPDWNLVRQVFCLPEQATMEEMQQAVKSKYSSGLAPPPFHIPICIALIDIDFQTSKVVNAVVLDMEEKTLLQQFWKIVRYRKGSIPVSTMLIHFNGRGFDLPVLFYRSLKHRISIYSWERNRYSFDAFRTMDEHSGLSIRKDQAYSHDLCDDLADFGAASRPSLNIVAKLLGLPGKTDIDGSNVEKLYFAGERERIRDYCMEDAMATYQIWLTMRYVRGEISEECYKECYETASDLIRNCRSATDSFFIA